MEHDIYEDYNYLNSLYVRDDNNILKPTKDISITIATYMNRKIEFSLTDDLKLCNVYINGIEVERDYNHIFLDIPKISIVNMLTDNYGKVIECIIYLFPECMRYKSLRLDDNNVSIDRDMYLEKVRRWDKYNKLLSIE